MEISSAANRELESLRIHIRAGHRRQGEIMRLRLIEVLKGNDPDKPNVQASEASQPVASKKASRKKGE